MPSRYTSAEHYARKLRSSCAKITKGESTLVSLDSVHETPDGSSYYFKIFGRRGLGPMHRAIVTVHSDMDVVISTDSPEFPEELLLCVAEHVERLA